MNEINAISAHTYLDGQIISGLLSSGADKDINYEKLMSMAAQMTDAMLEARKPKEALEMKLNQDEILQKTHAKIAIARLNTMLAQYRNGVRGLPTYAELIELVQQ